MQFRFSYLPFIFAFTIFFIAAANAQKAKLLIQISNDRLQINDTLEFVATYSLGEKKLPPATLALVIKENNGDGIWQLRWPMLDGHSEGSILFPDSIKRGNYTCYFAVQPRFFQVYGRVLYPPTLKKISGVIYSPHFDPKEFEVPVESGIFKIDKFLFESTAVLELDVEQKKKMPAITIDAWLDSTFEPAASVSKEITIGMGEHSVMQNKKVENWMIFFDPYYQTSILGKMSEAQKFDSIYVSPLFKKDVIAQFDCLSDSTLLKSKSLEEFLSRYYPDFKMNPAYSENQTPTAHSKEYNFIFYLDEKPATFASLNNMRLSDIASIKILPPITTSMASFENKQTIIALFTKQGPFWSQDFYRYKYLINGYQPAIYQLPQSPKMFATNPYYLR